MATSSARAKAAWRKRQREALEAAAVASGSYQKYSRLPAYSPATAMPGFSRRVGYYGRYRASGRVGEMKFLDTTVAQTTVAAAGTVLSSSLNVVPQGDQQSERIGRKITIKSIHLRGRSILPAGAAYDTLRLIVYVDTQTNGAAATAADILQGAAPTLESFNNMENAGRFRVLKDWYYNMNSINSVGATPDETASARVLKMNKKCNIPILYDSSATTGAIATQCCNNVGVIGFSTGQGITVGFVVRIRYSDS